MISIGNIPKPNSKIEKSNNGDIIKTAGTTPINALAKAAIVKDIIISLNLIEKQIDWSNFCSKSLQGKAY